MTNQPKILIVDDEALILKAYRDGLVRAGYQVIVAENGRVALEQLKNHPIDLVLLDIIMPEMDGLEVLEQIKSDPKLKAIPVLVLSVSGQIHDIQTSKKLGAEDYLVKTEYSMKEIVNRVKFHLESSVVR